MSISIGARCLAGLTAQSWCANHTGKKHKFVMGKHYRILIIFHINNASYLVTNLSTFKADPVSYKHGSILALLYVNTGVLLSVTVPVCAWCRQPRRKWIAAETSWPRKSTTNYSWLTFHAPPIVDFTNQAREATSLPDCDISVRIDVR